MRIAASLIFAATLSAAGPSAAIDVAAELDRCAEIADANPRLTCFDALTARLPSFLSHSADTPEQKQPSQLSRHWELEQKDKQGTFSVRTHQKNYLLLANYSSSPNAEPFAPFKEMMPPGEAAGLMHTEVKYQLSFKTKVLENLTPLHADLWAAYTQQSQWQAYNRLASSPFRDTNYQPELMLVVPMDVPLPGLRLRFANFGIVHQSNGQTMHLSRSWDRVYAQVGLENGNFSLLGRVWDRRNESRDDDDNPDILNYMGHGDVVARYNWNEHIFSLTARRNFRSKHGALQADWAFPLAPHLKGYVQAFSGYGQSLIDYNHRQTTFGLGVLIDY